MENCLSVGLREEATNDIYIYNDIQYLTNMHPQRTNSKNDQNDALLSWWDLCECRAFEFIDYIG